jgi:hypothetical protein
LKADISNQSNFGSKMDEDYNDEWFKEKEKFKQEIHASA